MQSGSLWKMHSLKQTEADNRNLERFKKKTGWVFNTVNNYPSVINKTSRDGLWTSAPLSHQNWKNLPSCRNKKHTPHTTSHTISLMHFQSLPSPSWSTVWNQTQLLLTALLHCCFNYVNQYSQLIPTNESIAPITHEGGRTLKVHPLEMKDVKRIHWWSVGGKKNRAAIPNT